MPSRDLTSEDLFSSRIMSMQSSTHSSQMKTVGPAISLRTSCWLLPQNEQYSVFLDSPLTLLLIPVSFTSRLSRIPHPKSYAEFLSSMTPARHASQASINIRLTLLYARNRFESSPFELAKAMPEGIGTRFFPRQIGHFRGFFGA